MGSVPLDDVPDLGPRKRDPIQHIRDRTMTRKKQLFPRPRSFENSSSSPKTIPRFRKQSEPTPLHRSSRAPSESVQVMLDHANANANANAKTSRTPSQDQFNGVAQWTATPIDTPLSTRRSFSFRRSVTSWRASDPNQEASPTDRKTYDAMKLNIQKDFVKELADVWLGEMVAHAIIQYYQGQRGELIEGLTHATYMAQEHDLKHLVGRAQLWKAIIFDETGHTTHIASILSDVLHLVRDFGDDMDCYQLLKLLPIYAHHIFRYCMVQAGEKQATDTASSFNSPASRGAFEAWYRYQMTTLEGKCNHQGWPDPLVARNAAHVSGMLKNSNLTPQNKSKAGHLVSPSKVTVEDTISSTGSEALLQHMMHLEDMLKCEKEERRNIEQAMFAEINYYKDKVYELHLNDPSLEHHRAAADTLTRSRISSRAFSRPITPGQVTAVNEILKATRPRSRQTPQSYEWEHVALNPPSRESSNIPIATQIEQWRRAHKEHSDSSASNPRESWTTSTDSPSQTDSSASDVPRPQPLRIRNPDQSSSTANSLRDHHKPTQTRARSRLQYSFDGRRTESRSARRRTSQALESTNWRNPGRSSVPEALPSAEAGNHATRADEDEHLFRKQDQPHGLQSLPAIITCTHPQPSPRPDASGTLHLTEKFNTTDQTRHDIPEGPSGPRLYPRRGSAPSSALVSPLTIDPLVELPLTDTPSPTKLKHTISTFRDHQEQRRRSTSLSISPTSMSYETERRRSHAAAGIRAREDHALSNEDLSTTVLEGSDLSADTGKAQYGGQAYAEQTKHSQPKLAVATNASNDNAFDAGSRDGSSSSDRGMQRSVSKGTASSNSSNIPSNKLLLGNRGISVGHGTAITGLSSDLSKLAQDSQPVPSTTKSDEKVFEAKQDIDASSVDPLDPDQNLDQVDSLDRAQPTVLPDTKETDVDAILLNRMHHRQGSIPVVPSPLREASRVDDIQDPVIKLEKQQSQGFQAGDDQPRPDLSGPHHVSGGQKLVGTDKLRQLNIRDFAYDQFSETSDLYGVGQGSPAGTTDFSPAPLSLNKEPSTSTNPIGESTSPVRMSRLYEEIENSYPSPIASDDASLSPSTATIGDTWPSIGSVRTSVIPRLDLDRLHRQRLKHREKALEDGDGAISPMTQLTGQSKTQTSPESSGQDQQEAVSEAIPKIVSTPGLNEKFQADVIARVPLEAAKTEEDDENEFSEEDIYGKFPSDKGVSPKSTADTTDKGSGQRQTLHEHDMSDLPRTTMEEYPEDDAEIANSTAQVEEHGPEGSLEFLLPKTYVPVAQHGEDRNDVEEETRLEREDMKKEIWSTGVI